MPAPPNKPKNSPAFQPYLNAWDMIPHWKEHVKLPPELINSWGYTIWGALQPFLDGWFGQLAYLTSLESSTLESFKEHIGPWTSTSDLSSVALNYLLDQGNKLYIQHLQPHFDLFGTNNPTWMIQYNMYIVDLINDVKLKKTTCPPDERRAFKKLAKRLTRFLYSNEVTALPCFPPSYMNPTKHMGFPIFGHQVLMNMIQMFIVIEAPLQLISCMFDPGQKFVSTQRWTSGHQPCYISHTSAINWTLCWWINSQEEDWPEEIGPQDDDQVWTIKNLILKIFGAIIEIMHSVLIPEIMKLQRICDPHTHPSMNKVHQDQLCKMLETRRKTVKEASHKNPKLKLVTSRYDPNITDILPYSAADTSRWISALQRIPHHLLNNPKSPENKKQYWISLLASVFDALYCMERLDTVLSSSTGYISFRHWLLKEINAAEDFTGFTFWDGFVYDHNPEDMKIEEIGEDVIKTNRRVQELKELATEFNTNFNLITRGIQTLVGLNKAGEESTDPQDYLIPPKVADALKILHGTTIINYMKNQHVFKENPETKYQMEKTYDYRLVSNSSQDSFPLGIKVATPEQMKKFWEEVNDSEGEDIAHEVMDQDKRRLTGKKRSLKEVDEEFTVGISRGKGKEAEEPRRKRMRAEE